MSGVRFPLLVLLVSFWGEAAQDDVLPKEAVIQIPKSMAQAPKKRKKKEDFPLSWNVDAAQRYKRFHEDPIDGVDRGGPPQPGDAEEAMALAEDVQCEVCKTILHFLFDGKNGTGKLTRDSIMDILEGDVDPARVEAAADRDDLNIERSRRGCNRHFKDSYMAHGWDVRSCVKFPKGADPKTQRDRGVPGLCRWRAPKLPDEAEMGTYALEKEAIFYACQHTIGKHSDELATFLAQALPSGRGPLDDMMGEACRDHARCLERKYSASVERRAALKLERLAQEREENATGARRKRRRKRRRGAGKAPAQGEL